MATYTLTEGLKGPASWPCMVTVGLDGRTYTMTEGLRGSIILGFFWGGSSEFSLKRHKILVFHLVKNKSYGNYFI